MHSFSISLRKNDLRPLRDERNRNIIQHLINDEWTIVCVMNLENDPWSIQSIEIHRENTSEEFSVSGEFGKRSHGGKIFTKKFSVIIPKGSSYQSLLSYFNQEIFTDKIIHPLRGLVNISVRKPNSLANRESKDIIQMRSFELLSKDFEKLLDPQSSSLTDVHLKCGSTCILAHKNILCARSRVFAAMFAHPTKESLKNEVDITDIDVSVLQAMLRYIYTGKTADLTSSSAADLLIAADKYQLLDLKAVCSYFLKETVCPENVWKMLVLGDMHDEDLKSFAADYICYKCGESSVLKNSEEWKALRNERPDLAMDILESMVSFIEKKLQR